ncbi:hypothetical protein BXZ70DRAFT_238746 [Cristinia sonorae]|uniref:Uncharacterized protein n=1 Tax=Cristinia sonorae TaxID=1940300 RepID=A0A8K0ULP7_9AGAR|nr:hypothetical protein BXZ70DRAFT_238746 [Cristinia sonorae]
MRDRFPLSFLPFRFSLFPCSISTASDGAMSFFSLHPIMHHSQWCSQVSFFAFPPTNSLLSSSLFLFYLFFFHFLPHGGSAESSPNVFLHVLSPSHTSTVPTRRLCRLPINSSATGVECDHSPRKCSRHILPLVGTEYTLCWAWTLWQTFTSCPGFYVITRIIHKRGICHCS